MAFGDMALLATVIPPELERDTFLRYSDILYEFRCEHSRIWGRPLGWRYQFRTALSLDDPVLVDFLDRLTVAMAKIDSRIVVRSLLGGGE